MAKRSPSGIHLPIIDNRYDQQATQTLVAGGTITLHRDVMTYMIVRAAAPLAGDTTVNLPAAPLNGDEVVLANLVTFVDPATQFVILSGNGKNIGNYGASFNVDRVAWVKYDLALDLWIPLNCCALTEIA